MNATNKFFNDNDITIIDALIDNIDNDFVVDDVTTTTFVDNDNHNNDCDTFCDMLISTM
ncbi:MAG: hypothetical protein ACTSUU_06785 [Candidatus Thorarchaeota archaeon]